MPIQWPKCCMCMDTGKAGGFSCPVCVPGPPDCGPMMMTKERPLAKEEAIRTFQEAGKLFNEASSAPMPGHPLWKGIDQLTCAICGIEKNRVCNASMPIEMMRRLGAAAVFAFGRDNQIEKCKEELAELQLELCRETGKRGRIDNIRSEVADVLFMATQMAELFGWNEVMMHLDLKMLRLDKSLKGLGH
jgi:NTP pyrophosphatase (non-canonical NTP hydrolase)